MGLIERPEFNLVQFMRMKCTVELKEAVGHGHTSKVCEACSVYASAIYRFMQTNIYML